MRMLKLCLGAALVMAIVAAGFAHAGENQAGTTAANFLNTGTGARVLAMGGATLGGGDDMQASAWNPAALGWMSVSEVSLAHGGTGAEQSQEWLGAGGRLGGRTRWGIQGLYQGDGSFEGRDASNLPTTTFTASSMALGVQVAHRFGDRFTVGTGTKFVREALGDVSGMGMTFDFGAQMHAAGFGLGAAATNVGGQMRYSGSVYPFPANYGAGVSYAVPNTGLSLALDANFPRAYASEVRFGSEWKWHDMVALRAGYRKVNSALANEPLTGPTFGIGAGRNGFWFDYGYLVSGGGVDAQHRLALSFHPGGWGSGGGQSYGHTDAEPLPQQSIAAASADADGPPTPSKQTTPKAQVETPKPEAVSVPASAPMAEWETAPAAAATTAASAASAASAAPASKPVVAAAPPLKLTPSKTAPVTPSTQSAVASAPVAASSVPAPVASTPSAAKASAAAAGSSAAKASAAAAGSSAAKVSASAAGSSAAKVSASADAPSVASTSNAAAAPAAASNQFAANESKVTTTVLSPPPIVPPVAAATTTSTPKPEVVAAPATQVEQAQTEARPAKVQIKKGETLASIGRRYGTSAAAIMMENNLVTQNIKVGQWVRLPK